MHGLHYGPALDAAADGVNFSAYKTVNEQIPVVAIFKGTTLDGVGQHKNASHVQACRGRCGLTSVVRLNGSRRNQSVGLGFECGGDYKFELTGLVTARS